MLRCLLCTRCKHNPIVYCCTSNCLPIYHIHARNLNISMFLLSSLGKYMRVCVSARQRLKRSLLRYVQRHHHMAVANLSNRGSSTINALQEALQKVLQRKSRTEAVTSVSSVIVYMRRTSPRGLFYVLLDSHEIRS